jgi:HTH-type transcriptional regulator / antitoxin HigA
MSLNKAAQRSPKRGTKQNANSPTPRAGASYLALVRGYPLLPICSEEDLDAALALVDRLLTREPPLDSGEEAYLETLAVLVQAYEDQHHPLPPVSGADMLRHFLEQHDKTLSQVARDTGIAVSTLSAVLNGKRQLNLRHIEKLAPYFGVEPAVFLEG